MDGASYFTAKLRGLWFWLARLGLAMESADALLSQRMDAVERDLADLRRKLCDGEGS